MRYYKPEPSQPEIKLQYNYYNQSPQRHIKKEVVHLSKIKNNTISKLNKSMFYPSLACAVVIAGIVYVVTL